MITRPDPAWTEPVPNPESFEDAAANLAHTLQVCADNEHDRMILMATGNIYGRGVHTGLTMRDLRLIAQRLGLETR